MPNKPVGLYHPNAIWRRRPSVVSALLKLAYAIAGHFESRKARREWDKHRKGGKLQK